MKLPFETFDAEKKYEKLGFSYTGYSNAEDLDSNTQDFQSFEAEKTGYFREIKKLEADFGYIVFSHYLDTRDQVMEAIKDGYIVSVRKSDNCDSVFTAGFLVPDANEAIRISEVYGFDEVFDISRGVHEDIKFLENYHDNT